MFIDDNDDSRSEAVEAVLTKAMGSAASSLANLIGREVDISQPSTHWVNKNNLMETISRINLPEQSIVIRQSFRGHLRGEIFILLEEGSKHHELGFIMGYESAMTPMNEQEFTLELANVLSGACIHGLSDELDVQLDFDAPSLLSQRASVDKLLAQRELFWTDALFMSVGYAVNSMSMKAHLIVCMIEEDSHELYHLIDLQLD